MPVYTYKRESTGEYIDVLQGMNDPHEYKGELGDELDWIRIFYVPNASIDTHSNPESPNQFLERTSKKKGTVGDLMDYSKELSDKRAEIHGGKDPIKEKYFDDYSKKRKGAKHPQQMKTFESKNVKVEYD